MNFEETSKRKVVDLDAVALLVEWKTHHMCKFVGPRYILFVTTTLLSLQLTRVGNLFRYSLSTSVGNE